MSFILPFLPLGSVLVYHGYTNANIDTQRVKTQLKYLPLSCWQGLCSPMAQETWFQSQVKSYHRLKKWYLMPPCLALSIICYGSRVKWSNPGKGVAPSPTPQSSSYRKGSLRVTLEYSRHLYFYNKQTVSTAGEK